MWQPVMIGVVTVGATSRTVAVGALVWVVVCKVSSVYEATTVTVSFSELSSRVGEVRCVDVAAGDDRRGHGRRHVKDGGGRRAGLGRGLQGVVGVRGDHGDGGVLVALEQRV